MNDPPPSDINTHLFDSVKSDVFSRPGIYVTALFSAMNI